MKRALPLALLLAAASAAFAQSPEEQVRACDVHLRAAQDEYRAELNVYADDALLLIDALHSRDAACLSDSVQFSQQKPFDLQAFGDGLITVEGDTYSSYIWHRGSDRLYVSSESGLNEVAPAAPFQGPEPSGEPIEAVEHFGGDLPDEPRVETPLRESAPEADPRAATEFSESTAEPLPTPSESGDLESAVQPLLAETEPQGSVDETQADLADAVRAADELLEKGDIQGAEALYLRLIQEDYQNSYAHDGLARARFLSGSLEEAATTLQVAASIEPESFLFQFNLGITLHLLERHPEAIQAFRSAVNLNPEDPVLRAEALTGLGLSQVHNGQASAAAGTLQQAVEADPNPDREYLVLMVRYRNGEGATLLPNVLAAAQQTEDYRFDVLAARIYRDLRDFTSSDTHLNRAEQRAEGETDLAQVLMQRAAMLLDAGGQPNVLLSQAHDLDPHLWEASYTQGVLALRERQFGLAIELLSEAHQHSRGEPTVTTALARAYLNAGQYDLARDYGQRAAEATEDTEAALTAAVAAYHLGDYPAADAILQRHGATEHGPEVTALAGAVKYQLRDYANAVTYFERAYRDAPSMDLRRNLVSALLATSRFQDAAVHLREMTRNNPNEGILHQQLGWAEHMMGNTIDAQLAFRRAAALGAPLSTE